MRMRNYAELRHEMDTTVQRFDSKWLDAQLAHLELDPEWKAATACQRVVVHMHLSFKAAGAVFT